MESYSNALKDFLLAAESNLDLDFDHKIQHMIGVCYHKYFNT